MKKLMLDIDALAVQSFATHPVAGSGTVHGAADLQQQFQPVTTRQTYPNCSEIDACPSALACTYQDTCSLCPQSAGCPVSDGAGFNTDGCRCSGPICIAEAIPGQPAID